MHGGPEFGPWSGHLALQFSRVESVLQVSTHLSSEVLRHHFAVNALFGLCSPPGGLFEYVTAANYFGEVVEWCGFALASWSPQAGAFALFTACSLFSIAQHHHQ